MQASTLPHASKLSDDSIGQDPRQLIQQLQELAQSLPKKKLQKFQQTCDQLITSLQLPADPFAELKSFGSSLDDILPHRTNAEPLLILSTIAFQLELRGEPHNPVEQTVCAISGLLSEMSLGGFIEYLESAAGDYAAVLSEILHRLGAEAHLNLLDQVFGLLGEMPPADHDLRVAMMDRMMANQTVEQWQMLNLQYQQLQEPLAMITMQYVEKNKQQIRL